MGTLALAYRFLLWNYHETIIRTVIFKNDGNEKAHEKIMGFKNEGGFSPPM
jgi:hypothetical protein